MTSLTYTITLTRTKTTDVPAQLLLHTRIDVRTRKPESRAYTIDIPTTAMPDTSTVPAQFRPLVDSALLDACEQTLQTFITSKATAGNYSIPASLFTLEALLAASATSRMTSAMLIGMWRISSKYVLEVAPKLAALQGIALLKYQDAITKHEKRLSTLVTREAEKSLSAADLDKLLINLADDDMDSAYGNYLAERTEEVRAKLVEDADAL